MISAVVLAAGRSSRMGRSKALLPHVDGATTFVAHIIRQARLAGVSTVIVVGRSADEELREAVETEGAVFVVNPEPDRGQLSSLVAGLDALGDDPWDGVVVLPVDVPLVSADVIRVLIERAPLTDAAILRVVNRGVHGHPVLFKSRVFGELRSADPAMGARAVVRSDPARVFDVAVEDAGVVADVDTPEDYRRLFDRRLE